MHCVVVCLPAYPYLIHKFWETASKVTWQKLPEDVSGAHQCDLSSLSLLLLKKRKNYCQSEHEHPRIDMRRYWLQWNITRIKENRTVWASIKNSIRQIINICIRSAYYILWRKDKYWTNPEILKLRRCSTADGGKAWLPYP